VVGVRRVQNGVFRKKPDSGTMPVMAKVDTKKVAQVTGISARTPPSG
jgi:hypothetical protein